MEQEKTAAPEEAISTPTDSEAITRVRKSLLYMYVEDYMGFHWESFNFAMSPRFRMETAEGKYTLKREKSNAERDDYWEKHPFFGENVTGLSLLIGENGSGKTTLFRLLLSWLCDLAAGECPKGNGVLVFRETTEQIKDGKKSLDFKDKCFPFLDEKTSVNCECAEIATLSEIRLFLSDVSFIYYTDTMTDLELFCQESALMLNEREDRFIDHSLNARLCSIPSDPFFKQNSRESFRRMDFVFQAKQLLNKKPNEDQARDFHVDFLRLSANHRLRDTILDRALDQLKAEDGEAIPERKNLQDYIEECFLKWEQLAARVPNIESVQYSVIGGVLWNFVALLLQRTEENDATVPVILKDGINSIKSLFINQLIDLDNPTSRLEPDPIAQFQDRVLTFIGNIQDNSENNDWINYYRENADCLLIHRAWISDASWEKPETINPQEKHILITTVSEIQKKFSTECAEFVKCYEQLPFLTDYFKLEWHFPSSGQDNYCNLMALFSSLWGGKPNCWIFMDEPDNAFHPEWKRTIINTILKECGEQAEKSFQLWITTHSPIMLSDVPAQSAILLKRPKSSGEPEKIQKHIIRSPFAQQIYTLFNDAFFLKEGVTGEFASGKIKQVYYSLQKQRGAASYKRVMDKEEIERIIDAVDEPLAKGFLYDYYQSYLRVKNAIKKAEETEQKEELLV